MGDVVTFGITRAFREQFAIGSVNRCSSAYTAGEVTGIVVSIATGFTAGTKVFARASSPNNWSNFSHSLVPHSAMRKSRNPFIRWLDKVGNRLNGDHIPTTGKRPDLHDLMDATAAGVAGKYPTWPVWRRLINRMPYTPGSAMYGITSSTINSQNSCGCGM